MFQTSDSPLPFEPARDGARRPVPVGLVMTDGETWVVVGCWGRALLDEVDLPAGDGAPPARICREVLPDGRLRIGGLEPGREQFLDDLLGVG